MQNKDLRHFAKENKVSFWQVADVQGISEPTMTRRLRRELPDTEKEKYRKIITDIASKRIDSSVTA